MLGGVVDAVAPADLPRLIGNFLANRSRELQLTVQPEPRRERPAYRLAWQYLVYDPIRAAWVPISPRLDERQP